MRLRLVVATAAALLLVSSAALAAVTGTYKGATGQHFSLTLKLYKKSSKLYVNYTTKFKYKCSASGPLTEPNGARGVPVKHQDGKYSVLVGGGGPQAGGFDEWSWTIAGKKLSGSVTSTYYHGTNHCQSGKVTFSATR
jgi:hypothetical protein